MRRMVSRMTEVAETRGTHHPYRFQDHAFEEQDVFSGYSTESLERLRKVRQSIDPDDVFQQLQPGYFKLDPESAKVNRNVRSEH